MATINKIAVTGGDTYDVEDAYIRGLVSGGLPLENGGTGVNVGTNLELANALRLAYIGAPSVIAAETNLNSIITPGTYEVQSNTVVKTLVNCPSASISGFYMTCRTVYGTEGRVLQEIHPYTRTMYFTRYVGDDGTWSPWVQNWGSGSAIKKITDSTLFTYSSGFTNRYFELDVMFGRIASINLSFKNTTALAAGTAYSLGSINSAIAAAIPSPCTGNNIVGVLDSAVYIRPTIAISAGSSLQVTSTFILATEYEN